MGRSGYETTNLWSAEDTETPYSICSADTPNIEEEHPLFKLKDSFLQVAMAAYMQANERGYQQDENVEAIDNIEASIEPVDHENDANDRPRKRGRLSDCASTAAGEKKSQRAGTKRRTQDRRLWLACPYAKKDPVRYRRCYGYFLGRVRDVKQHLDRCHRKPICCPICNEIFDDEDEKDAHIRSQSCTRRPSIKIEGVSEKQRKELKHRVSSKLSEDQQWFAVWDALFSPHPRPKTPYRDRELSEDLCVFQDFMTARGPALLAEFLETRGMTISNLPNEERDLATFNKEILGEGLQLIIDQWTADSAATEQRSATQSLRSSPTVDSGIALHIDYSKTTERYKTENPPGSDPTNSSPDEKKHVKDNTQRIDNVFSIEENTGRGATAFQAHGEPEHHTQSMMDWSTNLSEDLSMDPSQKHTEILNSLDMSQFGVIPDYTEANIFPAATGAADLLNFDIGWPP
ncbi:uncharacterized protein GGS22DRAFT_178773 [Annulohypoxylon maeteangense]|uniref:uncharacterized protein n=1 Tax=Annulohypoxylon maeteangense TaxID=1927788 RepID=UPI00200767DC|nr:uncharacterized protein GGS22DRAFT_178773 [Annulohypoxylon maeteangense]KAI0886649.1 hypothetical protein GGS22DRAFT_178773 [Annulohypoxylon maeteangense]